FVAMHRVNSRQRSTLVAFGAKRVLTEPRSERGRCIQRPEPPPELSAEESAEWTATTRAMKPDWFGPETRPILAAYCLHVVTANMVAQRLRTTTIDAPDFRQLAAMHRSRDQDGAVDRHQAASHARSNRYAVNRR